MTLSIHLEEEIPPLSTALDYASKFTNVYIARPNKGEGTERTVLLGKTRKTNRWVQVLKIWGNNKQDTQNFALNVLKKLKEQQNDQ